MGNLNPFRYRGYYYDTESQLYYPMTRYYDPTTHRFINADGYFKTNNGVLGTNMSAYCLNNPVNRIDPEGTFSSREIQEELAFNRSTKYSIIDALNELKKENKYPGLTTSTSNSLPPTGQPNSKSKLYNPDGSIKQERWYGPDGKHLRDRDYNHGGKMPFPHDHDWKNGDRGKEHLEPSPDYEFSWDEDIFNNGWSFNFNFNPPMGDKPIWEKALKTLCVFFLNRK